MSTTTIQLSPSACEYIAKMVAKDHGLGFRLSIKKTGCSGFTYAPQVVHEINPQDEIIQTENGVQIYIDRSWLHLLQNLQIDYLEDAKSGLKQKRLAFTNPSEASRCGCGESFHVSNIE